MARTKQQLIVDNNTSFPNNTTNYITPAILRDFNSNVIDSLVDEIPYGEYTQSVAVSIEALNAFTASASGLTTGSLLITASALSNVITFTKGDSSQFSVTVADTTDLSALNQATASLQAFTASAAISITNLNASSASQQTSINNLNSATSSLNSSISSLNTSASLALVTASFDNNTRNLTFTKGDTTIFNVNIPDVSGSAGSFVTTSSFNAYTASTDSSISQLNASTASQQISINALNTNSASVNTSITNINLATASLQGQLATIGTQSGSWITESETGSFATTGSNVFVGNQTISGSLFVSGSEVLTGTLSASALRVENNTYLDGTLTVTNDTTMTGDLLIQSTSPKLKLRDTSGGGFSSGYDLTIDTGSFIINDETHDRPVLSDIYNPSTLKHTTELTSEIIVISGSESVTIQGGLTASLAAGYAWVGNGSGLTQQVATSSFVVSINTGSLATTGSNVFVGNQTISGSITQSGSTTINTPNGAVNGLTINNGGLQSQGTIVGNNGQNLFGLDKGLTIAANSALSGSPYSQFFIYVDNTTDPTNVFSSINLLDAQTTNGVGLAWSSYSGYATTTPVFFANQQYNGSDLAFGFPTNQIDVWKPTQFKAPITATGSINLSGSFTASLQQGYVWVGDASGKTTTIATSSLQTNVSNLATTGSNAFFGTNSFSGAVEFTGSAPTILSSSFSGSLITNLTDIYTDVPEVKQIVTLTSASYAALVTGGTVDPNTLYVVSGSTSTNYATLGSNTFVGNQIITGSLITTGSTVQIYKDGGNGLEIFNSGLLSQGAISGQNNINSLGQYAQMNIMANTSFSGSQYPIANVVIAPNVYTTDIYGGYGVVTEQGNQLGQTFVGLIGSSYLPQYSGTTMPAIIANGNNPAGNDTAIIWTSDGSAEHYKKSRFKYGMDVTGSLVASGSFVLTGSAAGNVVSASITSNTASIDFSKGNYFEVTSSVTPLHLNITNIQPGTTSTLIVSASASSSILFSPNVAQPSGSAYSGSAGSIDILSLVAFNTSKVNVVSTKAFV